MAASVSTQIIAPLQGVEYEFGQSVHHTMFGGDMLRFTETSTFEEASLTIGISSIRWPGGLIANPNFSASDEPATNRWVTGVDDFGRPNSYVYDLTHENIIETTGWPREGLSEAFEFAVENDLAFTMLIPEDRYIVVDQTTDPATVFVDIESATTDLSVFLERLVTGHFGEVPRNFSLQFGQEYYNGMIQNLVDDEVITHKAHVEALGQFYNRAAQFIDSEIEKLSNDGLNPESVLPNLIIHGGRLFGDPNKSKGSFEDSQILSDQFDALGIAAIDGLLIQRYVPSWSGVSLGLSEDIHGNSLADLERVWTNAAERLGIADKEFKISAGWAKSSLTESEIRSDYQGSLTDLEFANRTNFDFEAYKQSRWENGQDYGAKHAALILQFFAELVDAGVDAGSYYGIGTELPGRLAGEDIEGETVVFAGGTMLQMMSESLNNHVLSRDFRKNYQHQENGGDQVNSVQFESKSEIVAYYWLDEVPDGGVDLNIVPDGIESLSNVFTQLSVRKLTSEPLENWQERFGVANLDQIWGEGFQEAEAAHYFVANENDAMSVVYELTDANSVPTLELSQGYQIIEVTFVKDLTISDYWTSPVGQSGDHAGTAFGDKFIGDASKNTVFLDAGDDSANGEGGDDRLYGESGDDFLAGDSGNDILEGGAGDDKISGGDGADYLSGGSNDDLIFGNSGNDLIFGNNGHDEVSGGLGDDTINSGGGNDTVRGDEGDDQITGDYGSDVLFGGEGDDWLMGGSGKDIVVGGLGDDLLQGGLEADVFVFAPSSGQDEIADFSRQDGDRLDLLAYGITDLDSLHNHAEVSVYQNATMIEFGGTETLHISNLNVFELSDDIFVF